MRHWTRETRLLVVTIVLSVSVLLALARLRFPGHEPPERLSLPARPLQQIADRAAFDDLGAAVGRVATEVRPALRVLPLDDDEGGSLGLDDVLGRRPRRVVALHVGGGRFVALADRVPSPATLPPAIAVAAHDTLRQVLVVSIQASAPVLSTSRPSLPAFTIVAEPTSAGVALRPVFIASTDTVRDPRWTEPVVALGAGVAPPGALAFSLEGAFVGGIADGVDGPVLVPADAILASAQQADDNPVPASIGIRVQRLDEGLRQAFAAEGQAGVVVSFVDPKGPAAGRLEPGDIVRSVGGTAIRTPADLLLRVAAARPGAAIALDVLRQGTAMAVTVDARSAAPASPAVEGPAPHPAGTGAVLAASPRGARVVRVADASPAAAAGLRPGDAIWWVQGAPAATPAAIAARWRSLAAGGRLALGIDRRGPALVTMMKP